MPQIRFERERFFCIAVSTESAPSLCLRRLKAATPSDCFYGLILSLVVIIPIWVC